MLVSCCSVLEDFLRHDEASDPSCRNWGLVGLARPAVARLSRALSRGRLGYVGGWRAATKKFFDPDTGIVAKIEKGLGVSTG